MPSRFPSACLMAVPNSHVFPSDQDLNVLLTSRDGDDDPEHRRDKRLRPSPPPLKIRIPTSSSSYVGDKEDDEGGLKTPTSAIHRISEMLQCPPAPRKPKSLPSKKRRAPRPLLLLDLSKEIDSWFPRPIVLDVGGPINKFEKHM